MVCFDISKYTAATISWRMLFVKEPVPVSRYLPATPCISGISKRSLCVTNGLLLKNNEKKHEYLSGKVRGQHFRIISVITPKSTILYAKNVWLLNYT